MTTFSFLFPEICPAGCNGSEVCPACNPLGVPLDWACYCCGGPVVPMGALGNREHGRCRNCGADQSRFPNPEDQILRDEEEAGLTPEELAAGQAGFDALFPILTRPGESLIDTVVAERAKTIFRARLEEDFGSNTSKEDLDAFAEDMFANDMKPRP